MSEDKKDESTRSVGIDIRHGEDNFFSGITTTGYDIGMRFDSSVNNTFNDIKIISLDAFIIIEKTQWQLDSLIIDKKFRQQVQDQLNDIKTATSKESATTSYMKLMSSLSDHVTVLTPILPQLFLLAGNLVS
ncbi:hypothetical protein BJ925_3692 [Rahnella aquatilis]|nr:hypothetical protein BJ925_3692 [Rahnella aquatilis]